MKKIRNFIKNNTKLLIGLIIGIIISGIGVYAATVELPYNSEEVSFDNTTAELELNGQSVENVQDALDALYEKASNASSGPDCAFELGDYISLTPTASSFTIRAGTTGYPGDQTINPSELTLWRVIDIHSDGSFDAVSEYVSSTGVYFQGATGYANFVGGLQTIAASYAKTGYTISTRMMGYGGQTPVIQTKSSTCTDTTCQTTTTYAFDGSTNSAPASSSTSSPISGTGAEYSGGVLGDTLYLKDYQLVGNVYKSNTSKYGTTGLKAYDVSSKSSAKAYWLASRRFHWYDASHFNFLGRLVDTSGNLGSSSIRYFDGGWYDINRSYSLRPILTLKSGVKISGGTGADDDPYELSV